MLMTRYLIFFGLSTLTFFNCLGQQRLVDSRSTVKFSIKNLGITVNGSFSGLSGNIKFDENNPGTASFEATVDASSINTGIGARDRHLKKPDYLDVEKFPAISFVSEKVTRASDGKYIVTGNLSIKNRIKQISFPFTANAEQGGTRFTGSFSINRRDFNVGGSSITLSDNLIIFLSVFAD
jgi:polyisoprenoid-binding protein YceI